MKISIKSLALASVFLLLPTSVMAQSSDHEAVDQVMKKFMSAYTTADNAKAKEVMPISGTI